MRGSPDRKDLRAPKGKLRTYLYTWTLEVRGFLSLEICSRVRVCTYYMRGKESMKSLCKLKHLAGKDLSIFLQIMRKKVLTKDS